MRVRSFFFAVGTLGCGSGSGTPPNPTPTHETVCRCEGTREHLAVVRVMDDPVPFQSTQGSGTPNSWAGMTFTVMLERMLRATRPSPGAPVREPSTTFRAWQFLTYRGGPIPRTHSDDPHFQTRVSRGQRLLVSFAGPDVYGADAWPVGILGFDPATDTLTRRLFSFPAGTPVSRVLDPAEWTCTPDTPRRGDCPGPDGGADASAD